MVENFSEKADFIWSIADLLRGDYKQSEYQKVILPLTVLRRLDCVTQRNKEDVLERYEQLQKQGIKNVAPALKKAAGEKVYNTSEYTFKSLCSDPDQIASNLQYYINSYDEETKEIFEKFDFGHQIQRLEDADLLYKIIRQFAELDLHPEDVPNEEMGYIYEELVRKFNELSNETAGEHFTPREVIELMVNLLFDEDDKVLTEEGVVRTVYDPACGTGGMLSVAEDHVRELNGGAKLHAFGQELNPETYAVCNSDMLIKGQNPDNIAYGNSFTNDGFADRSFDYMLSNPPFGVSWKKVREYIEQEHEEKGKDGRFDAGTPRVSDGSLLFLQHMASKMKPPEEGGSRIAIVFNGSPLFNGGPNSGESAIRRWIIENDWLEAVIGLPNRLFYNTEIYTYVWILSNAKSERRQGRVQLIDAREMYVELEEGLGDKKYKISKNHISEISKIFGEMEESNRSKFYDNDDFGYRRIVVDRPLRMSFQVTDERIQKLKKEKAFSNRDEETQQHVIDALSSLDSDKQWMNKDEFLNQVELTFNMRNVDVRKSVYNAIVRALGERNSDADIVTDSNGDAEYDIDRREREKIPLGSDPYEYFERNIEPYAPNAWINDDSKYYDEDGDLGIVGYEINFLEKFLSSDPSSSVEEINEEISIIKSEISSKTQELLNKKHEIITRSLEDSDGLKSGPSWLVGIPENWDSSPLKYNVSIETGSTPKTTVDRYWDGEIPWFSPKDMKSDLLEDSQDHITKEALEETSISILPPKTVFVVVRGMILDRTLPVGLSEVPATINQDMKALRPDDHLLPEYLALLLRAISPLLLEVVKESSHGTKRLDTEDLENIEIPIPPVDEQRQILEDVERRTNKIDSKIDEIYRLRDDVEALEAAVGNQRQALLMSAVTGQLSDK
ncbi:N-6 DNA methylase [Haloferax denitrificans]|uniref:site-specific DNA-methyltransferase (adenine-specific) n=1 Tax=Haloferax denitrificans ATCC 35960 TaxID=662478 RepID=M0JHX0_9EURY|nr:N-6 DNA methylase [Haloferax denitrificans]EMA08576.1 N-6 DNA methylase [Haloferax denitrificans ATCC 35960]